MKNKIFVFLSFALSIFYLISPFSVKAYYIVNPEDHLVPTTYDNDVSIFDKYGNDLPPCRSDLYIIDAPVSQGSSYHRVYPNQYNISSVTKTKLCSSGYAPDLSKIKQYFKYFTRLIYTNRLNGKEYDIFIISQRIYNIDTNEEISPKLHVNGVSSTDHDNYLFANNYDLVISAIDEDLHLSNDLTVNSRIGGKDYNFLYSSYKVYYGTYPMGKLGNIYQGGFYWTPMLENSVENNIYFDLKIITNYPLYWGNGNLAVEETSGPYYGTDVDLTIPKDFYALLIPKKDYSFYTHIWTDSNFLYSLADYDSINYNPQGFGALDEISFAALNGYNWARWDFNFSSDDIANHRVLQVFNHGDSDLHLKISNSDFYYSILTKGSDDVCVGEFCYKNNYDYLHTAGNNHPINNVYELDEVNNNINYLNSLKNFIPNFSKAFVFVGTCVSSIFSIFNTEIAAYFYILFGLMIIMLIINIMK